VNNSPKPCDGKDCNSSQTVPGAVRLVVRTGFNIPSKKNKHFPLTNGGLGIDKAVKQKMAHLESSILSALYSWCPTGASATDSECRKQLRTLLYSLSDDSIREIPEASFGVEYVPAGEEGCIIEITVLPPKPGDRTRFTDAPDPLLPHSANAT
jgi:hypothetical protein